MKEVNVKVLIPDDVDPKKVIDLSLVVRYQKENNRWQFVTMPFTLTDSTKTELEKIRAEIEAKEKEVGFMDEASGGYNSAIFDVLDIIDEELRGKDE